MPTYLYKDLENGEIYEIKQSMRDESLTCHPETGAPIKRVPSRPAIAFKGAGFYANDSRPKDTSASAPKTETPQSESAKSESAKSESAKSDAPKPAPAKASGGE